jgi:hypothetical protein
MAQIAARSPGVVSAHMPSSPGRASACSRHSAETGHPAQIRFARFMSSCPAENHQSVGYPRHALSASQLARSDVFVNTSGA